MSNPAQKEILQARDQALSSLLEYMASAPILNENLILQGGGALHHIYGSPRFSNDLDFVSPDYPVSIEDTISALTENLPISIQNKYSSRIAKSNHDFTRVSYDPIVYQNCQQPSAHIEIKHQSAEEFEPTQGAYHPLLVETPREIYADKIVASLHRMSRRGSIKPTDIYDLNYLVDILNGQCDLEKIQRKAQTYSDLGWKADVVEGVLDQLTNRENFHKFRQIIAKTLMPDVVAHQKFSDDYFLNSREHFERVLDYIK